MEGVSSGLRLPHILVCNGMRSLCEIRRGMWNARQRIDFSGPAKCAIAVAQFHNPGLEDGIY
jgi:hypothetical protein